MKGGTPDAGTPDAATADATTPDVATPEATTPQTGSPDEATPEAATPEAATPEAATPEAATPEAATPEAGAADWSAAFDALYDFEETELGTDSSGHGRHLQTVGAPQRDSDPAHGAFSALFANEGQAEGTPQGPAQYLFTTDEFVRTLDSPSVTVGAWVRSPLQTNHDYAVVSNGDEQKGGFSLRVRLDLMAVRCMIGANLEASYIDEILVADYREWNHIVCRYDSDTQLLQYFVNGLAPEPAVEVPEGIGQGWGELRVGQGYTGALDEVFFIKRALTDQQIARVWGCGVDGKACSCSSSDPATYQTCGRLDDCAQTALPACDSILAP